MSTINLHCLCGVMNFCILQDGETALKRACYWGKSECVDLLLNAGAKTDIQEEVAIAQSAFD